MNIVLVEKTSDKIVNKDQMGGYGINTQVGKSLFARWIMRQKKSIRNIPILSLGYLAGIFSRDGHRIEVLNGGAIPQADLFIIASSIVDYKSELGMASRIRKEFPAAKIGFIGPFAGYLADEYLKAGDFVIKGEPEHIAMRISKGGIPKGIVESPSIADLDSLPFPEWKFFNVSKYYYFPTIRKRPFLSIQSSRGCVYSCSYCPYLTYQANWRTRSVENIIAEIKYLKDKFGIKSLLFRDPLFSLDKNRCREIAERIRGEALKIEWACETRADLLDEELIDIMYNAGLRAVNLGIESSRQEILDKYGRRPLDMEYQERIIAHAEKKGIKIISFYILGLPHDTVDIIRNTICYAKRLNTFLSQFHILTPFPGTEFYNQVKDLISEPDWEKFNSFTPVMRHDNLSSEDLSGLKEQAFVTYYFRLSYIMKHFKHLLPLWKKMLPF